MSKLLRISVVFSFAAMLIVGATVMIGRQAQAVGDPCETVVPTSAPATNTPAPTETLVDDTVTPAPTDTPTDTPTETLPPPTDTATDIPPTNTEVPTETLQPPALVGNQFAGVNNVGSSRVLYQAVDCVTPPPVATTNPVTELPNTGTGSEGGSNTWILALILMIAASAVAVRMRYVARR